MDDEDSGSTVNLVVATQGSSSFLTDSVELKDVAKKLSKASKTAVEILSKCLESKDERVRMQAATKLLEFHVTVAKEISHDQMQRLIAEIKVARAPGNKLIGADYPGDDKKKPIVDFTTIRQIN
jgi:hypothetical protein